MEGDAHSLCVAEQSLTCLYVDVPLGVETAEDDTVGSQLAAHVDVELHAPDFKGRIGKVASAWTDDDVKTGALKLMPRHGNLSIRGRGSTFGNASTELHSVGTAFLSSYTALHSIGTYLKLKIVSVHSMQKKGRHQLVPVSKVLFQGYLADATEMAASFEVGGKELVHDF